MSRPGLGAARPLYEAGAACEAAWVEWNVEQVLESFVAPEGYRLEHAGEGDVADIVSRLQAWFPEISVGSESAYLEPEYYLGEVYLRGGDARRDTLVMLARPLDARDIVAVLSLQRDARGRTLMGRMGAVDPAHRGLALGLLGVRMLETCGAAMQAELLHWVATLKTRHQQVIAERMGYTLVGIVPAYDRSMVAPGEVKRVYEALYARVTVDRSQVQEPAQGALTARTRALYLHLFGEPTSAEPLP